jgi:hypothetical protein
VQSPSFTQWFFSIYVSFWKCIQTHYHFPPFIDKVNECSGDISPTTHKLAFPTYNSCMARIWKEAFDSAKHGGLADALPDTVEPLRRLWTAPTLVAHDVIFVSVCSFTFCFYSRQQLERVLNYYEQKIVPSSREPESVWGLRGGDHSEAERWFERLSLFLREESKRLKVVKALQDALKMFPD